MDEVLFWATDLVVAASALLGLCFVWAEPVRRYRRRWGWLGERHPWFRIVTSSPMRVIASLIVLASVLTLFAGRAGQSDRDSSPSHATRPSGYTVTMTSAGGAGSSE